jgi:hypothetical protein
MVMADPRRGENRQCWLIEPWGAIQLEPCLFPEDEGWLEFAQACVGGYVEQIQARSFAKRDIVSAFCNEEGLIHGMQENFTASEFFTIRLVGRVLMYVRT